MNRTLGSSSMGVLLTVLTVISLASRGARTQAFGDDYGDNATAAQAIAIGSVRAGCIEIDVDQDWFSFRATNSLKEYVVTVTAGTLWDSAVTLVAWDGVTGIVQTDSVLMSPSRVSRIHVGPSATYFVHVAGFAQFTTGTYSVAVSQRNFADQNGNDLPDAWEIEYFHGTNAPGGGTFEDWDGDGADNLDEFRSGTDPTDTNACLRITAIAARDGGTAIAWTTAPYRWYGVDAATNLSEGKWDCLGVVTNLDHSGPLDFGEPANAFPARFYRVRCLY